MFKKAEFLLSAAAAQHFPKLLDKGGNEMEEIAFAGRSNVGKSSLLNHLVQKKDLARVSSTPGKTQLINFFEIDETFVLVDLPGYGFAKVSKSKREGWGEVIQDYLEEREALKLIVLLVDLRHPPTKEDIAFARWALHFKKPLLIVFTKADKLKKSQVPIHCRKNLTLLLEEIGDTPVAQIPYSIKDRKGRIALIHEIKKQLKWD